MVALASAGSSASLTGVPDVAVSAAVALSPALDHELRLQDERVDALSRERRLHPAVLDDLPDGAMVLHAGAPHLVLGPRLFCWEEAGYAAGVSRPAGTQTTLVTPPSLVELLRGGWESALPLIHPSARSAT